jgi:hypothetical protein
MFAARRWGTGVMRAWCVVTLLPCKAELCARPEISRRTTIFKSAAATVTRNGGYQSERLTWLLLLLSGIEVGSVLSCT